MKFPEELRQAILQEISAGPKVLASHSQELSHRYREAKREKNAYMSTSLHHEAYLLTRMPATFAALAYVFQELKKRYELSLENMLDLGCGPGTGMWAALSLFPSIKKISLIEQDRDLLSFAGRFGSLLKEEISSRIQNLEEVKEFDPHDLVLFSYSLGELKNRKNVLMAAYRAAKVIVVVEPGTPKGFEVIREAREELIQEGAKIVAPCPHALKCPMEGGDWCHFKVRLERSKEHKNIKSAELSYEDEKFSYMIAVKDEYEPSFHSRILRHPHKHPGHISFTLCTNLGVVNKIISKREKELYREAKKKEWGDTF